MKIGIDIDGVLTDEDKFMYDYGTKFCKERQLPMIIKPNLMEEAIFEWDEEISEQFWNTYLVEYVTRYPARQFAAEVIQKLKEKHEIYIVTQNLFRIIIRLFLRNHIQRIFWDFR